IQFLNKMEIFSIIFRCKQNSITQTTSSTFTPINGYNLIISANCTWFTFSKFSPTCNFNLLNLLKVGVEFNLFNICSLGTVILIALMFLTFLPIRLLLISEVFMAWFLSVLFYHFVCIANIQTLV